MPAQRPTDLVFTLFGEYLLHRSEPAWVGSLIAFLQPFGLSEGAVRTTLSRMARRGWLLRERIGRNSFYELSPRGRRLLEEGADRIFHPSWDEPWDGSWLLLAYSIPEDLRHLRDRLRSQLTWLGFGSLGNGLWLNPHDVEREVRSLTEELEIGEHLEVFRARRVQGEAPAALVAKCWDLEAINERYARFVERWAPKLQRFRDGGCDIDRERCFALRFHLIHEFRTFPLEDPYLPRVLLPPGWKGDEAAELFHALHDELVGPADLHVDTILSHTPDH